LFEDHDAKSVTGEVTRNTIGGGPNPNVVENLTTDASGNITGTVTVTSARQFTVEGFVRTSHGRVDTKVEQDINFSNSQSFNITNTAFVQNITQRTNISSETVTRRHGDGDDDASVSSSLQRFEWPLDLNFSFIINPDGTGAQTTTIKQQFLSKRTSRGDDGEDAFSIVSNTVTPSDTLLFDASFNITGSTGQQNTQAFFSDDSVGGCFSRTITAATGLLTSITDGKGCEDDDHRE
jgi:hypothetical protein